MNNSLARIHKLKKRRILVLFAASIDNGMLCLYVECGKEDWTILGHLTLPYPQPLRAAAEAVVDDSQSMMSLNDFAALDYRMSIFYVEGANAMLSHVSKLFKKPDVVVVNRFQLWKTPLEAQAIRFWNIGMGDCQMLADTLSTAVCTGFTRGDILLGKNGVLPTLSGDCCIARKIGPIAFLVNIGFNARLTIIDAAKSTILLDRETGPGTSLINIVAQDAGCSDGFDRDGSIAAGGTVDTMVMEELLALEGIRQPQSSSTGQIGELKKMIAASGLNTLSPASKLATVAALTARAISQTYQNEFHYVAAPSVLWVSGGGSNNLTVMEFLRSYFAPMAVKSIEELGLPSDGRFPLALGLTVQAFLDNQKIVLSAGKVSETTLPGRWVLPASG
jgi:1,6-anhydro-N-acetylmuramate kinase